MAQMVVQCLSADPRNRPTAKALAMQLQSIVAQVDFLPSQFIASSSALGFNESLTPSTSGFDLTPASDGSLGGTSTINKVGNPKRVLSCDLSETDSYLL